MVRWRCAGGRAQKSSARDGSRGRVQSKLRGERRGKPFRAHAARLAVYSALMALLGPPHIRAQTALMPPLVIENDLGGRLHPRLLDLRRLRRSGQPVRIEGRVCYSTCTLYLGLEDVCISPETMFGFHGPSSYGRPLPEAEFNTASRMIAAQYPEPLRAWYLREGRYQIHGLYLIDAPQIIAMGIAPC